MSEQASTTEYNATQASSEFAEFSPLVHPELALQTYESFAGGPERKAEKAAFVEGDTRHLRMTYPRLIEDEAQAVELTLLQLKNKAVQTYGKDSLTVSSIDYRLQEAKFLQVAARFNEATPNTTEQQQLAQEYVKLTEELYGKPEQDIIDAMLVTLRSKYNGTDHQVQQLWQQLENGFSIELKNGEVVTVPALQIPKNAERKLPVLTPQATELLTAEWKLAFPAIVEARGVMADVLAAQEGLLEDYDPNAIRFNGAATMRVFESATKGIAEQHQVAPFNVEENTVGTGASWETSRNAVVVAVNAKPRTWTNMRQVGVHESMHGLKAANGAKTAEPAMATGVFSRNADGTYTDYLTFEEGNNRLGEQILEEDALQEDIMGSSYNYYMLAGLFYMGYDDRQAKEVFARLVTIEKLSLHPQLDAIATREAASRAAASPVERFKRSTPTSDILVEGHTPIFTKDIAYFKGRLIATEHWNSVAQEAQAAGQQAYNTVLYNGDSVAAAEKAKRTAQRDYFHSEFALQLQGKIDPTSPVQYAAAKQAYQATL